MHKNNSLSAIMQGVLSPALCIIAKLVYGFPFGQVETVQPFPMNGFAPPMRCRRAGPLKPTIYGN
jgi:hypothetical protein